MLAAMRHEPPSDRRQRANRFFRKVSLRHTLRHSLHLDAPEDKDANDAASFF